MRSTPGISFLPRGATHRELGLFPGTKPLGKKPLRGRTSSYPGIFASPKCLGEAIFESLLERDFHTLLCTDPRVQAYARRAHYPVEGGSPDYGSISCLFGESRAGKSSVASKYERSFEPKVGESGMIFPVKRVNISTGGEKALLHHIADTLDLPYSLRMAYHPLLKEIMKSLKNLQVELLILDEVNTIANDNNAGSRNS